MSSARSDSQALSDNDIRQITAKLAEGRRPRVWFTAQAVGMREGRSGTVIQVGDPGEIDFLRVQPTGSTDALAFSPNELTLTKPARATRAAAADRTLW